MLKLDFTPIKNCNYKNSYEDILQSLYAHALYNDIPKMASELRELCKTDLFFLLYFVLGIKAVNHPWIIDRIREVEENHNQTLDLWSREHYKSSVLTYGLIIQEFLNNVEERIVIFSHTRGIAQAFLRRIKLTFESNELLKTLFPDILYADPKNQSPKWSEDDGIILKRQGTYTESSLEAWGFMEGMPTSRHYTIRVYDDIVTDKSVTTPDQIRKTDDAFKLSQFLKARGGTARVIGTRYHFADQYAKMKKSKGWEVRERVGVSGKTSVFMTDKELEDFKQIVCDGNTYIYNCLPGYTKIVMSDFGIKEIKDIQIGEEVLGIFQGTAQKKGGFCTSKVLATSKQQGMVLLYHLDNGESLCCTEPHKWWSGRWNNETDKRRLYLPLHPDKNKKNYTSIVVKALDLNILPLSEEQLHCALWLGGIFDGEGSVSGGLLTIAQSKKHNPEVCNRIEHCLKVLNFDYGIQTRSDEKAGVLIYYLRGGRNEVFRFLTVTKPAKWFQIVKGLLYRSSRISGVDKKVSVIGMEFLGNDVVYNIQTETGNYIANGYVSSNCQMLLDPVAEEAQEFKRHWLQYYRMLPDRAMNLYLFCDPANEKKTKGMGSDYTVFWLWGLDPLGNFFLIDMLRERLNLFERWNSLKKFMTKHPQIRKVYYEQYGMQADVQHFQSKMREDGIYFHIDPIGGRLKKEDRIRKLIPLFEGGKVWLPEVLYSSSGRDLVKEFVEEEYTLFPYASHDDMLDAASRVRDDEVEAWPPMGFPQERDEDLEDSNVVQMNTWAQRKANSRFANQ